MNNPNIDHHGFQVLITIDFCGEGTKPAPFSDESEHSIIQSEGLTVTANQSGRTIIYGDIGSNAYIILHGEVCIDGCDLLDRSKQAEILHKRYLQVGIEGLAHSLNGSFLIWVVDTAKNIVHLITDRLGSKKAFYLQQKNRIYIASSLRLLPARPIDPVGAAIYLQNSFIFSGRTVLDGVTSLRRASIHSFSTSERTSQDYWDYTFEFSGEEGLENECQDEEILAQLYRTAVQRRIPESGRIFLSLSGGIDSRAVLGCLLEAVEDRSRLIAYSYGELDDGDVQAATELAAKCGIEHHISSFMGNLSLTVQRNGKLCEGMVGFYTHGIDGLFDAMGDFTENDVLFVGDMPVQRGRTDFQSINDVLHRVEIQTPVRIPSYYAFGDFNHIAIQSAIEEDLEQLLLNIKRFDNLEDAHDYLFITQRDSNMLLPWREYHHSRFITVANPFLDNEIIEFYQSRPRNYRRNKFLHSATVRSMFPELCKVPFPESGVSNRDIHYQIYTHRLELANLINRFESRLDPLLPPELLAIAHQDCAHNIFLEKKPIPKWLRTIIDRLRRRYLKTKLGRSMRASKGKEATDLPLPALGARQLELILALRCFLA